MDDEATVDHGGQAQIICSLSWEEIDHIIGSLVEQIRADGSPEIIVGLQRGGLVPAVMLSHQLEVQGFLTLPVRCTTSDTVYASKCFPVVLPHDLFTQIAGKDVLVVDDVVGSGATLKEVLRTLCRYVPSRIRSAISILNQEHWKLANEQHPTTLITYVGKELSGWVVFPWEKSVPCNIAKVRSSLLSPQSLEAPLISPLVKSVEGKKW